MQNEDCHTPHADAAEQPPQGCVFLQNPFPDCYCMNISSANIRKMLAFCTGDYRACLIYRKKIQEAPAPACAFTK